MITMTLKSIKKHIYGILGLVSFMTRIPVNIYCDLETVSKYLVFIVFIGAFIGLIGGLISLPFYYLNIDSEVVGILVLFTMLYIQGFHHVDGLGDCGDCWMVMGNKNRKLEVMKDKYMGVGAFMWILFFELISIFGIYYFYHILLNNMGGYLFIKLIIIIETVSRLGLLSCACCGIPHREGTGRYFVKNTNEFHLLVGYLFVLGLSYLLGIFKMGILLSTLSIMIGMLIAWYHNRTIGVVNGDVLGASCEIVRSMSFIVLILTFNGLINY